MSIIPDCRVDENYNADFLNEKDSEFISGYDYALTQILNLIQNNLEVYQNELTEISPYKDGCPEDEIYASRRDLFDIVEENKGLISNIISDWHERERDTIITSFIENMSEEEYENCKKTALEKNKGKEYYDSRSFAALMKH